MLFSHHMTFCLQDKTVFSIDVAPLFREFVQNKEKNVNHVCSFLALNIILFLSYLYLAGRGNSTVVSVSVYQAGDPGSHPPRSACHRKVEFYHRAIDLLPPVPTTGSKKAVHELLYLCNNACKRSLAICRKSRALCPVSRLLSALNREVNMIQLYTEKDKIGKNL